MNGIQLLKEVSERHPGIVRIVLSGQADMASTLAVVGPAHQYLDKPCDAATLRDTIARALALRERISSKAIAGLVAKISSLPSVPHVRSVRL